MFKPRTHVWLASVAALAVGGWALADESDLPFCLVPSADTMIDQQNRDQNYGSAEEMQVRARQQTVAFDEGQEIDTLVRFDLAPVRDAKITSAKLYFYYSHWVYSDPGGRDLKCYRITSRWSEQGVTWRERPSIAPEAIGGTTVPAEKGNWLVFDVTEEVQAMLTEGMPHHGWMIKDEPVVDGAGGALPYRPDACTCFLTADHGQLVPYLMIETTCAADIDADGTTGFEDLLLLLGSWGSCH